MPFCPAYRSSGLACAKSLLESVQEGVSLVDKVRCLMIPMRGQNTHAADPGRMQQLLAHNVLLPAGLT